MRQTRPANLQCLPSTNPAGLGPQRALASVGLLAGSDGSSTMRETLVASMRANSARSGLAVILGAHERAEHDGYVLRVLRPTGQVARVFELCGLDEVLADGAKTSRH